MTVIYPYEKATNNVSASNISSSVFKKNFDPRKDALLQLKRYAEQYNINYSKLFDLYNKNITFYQNQFTANNPNLTQAEIAAKQKKAFEDSIYRTASQNLVQDIARDNINNQFIWLPSAAENPRDRHQQFYGKTFSFSNPPDNVLPGEAYNCQCGMEILV